MTIEKLKRALVEVKRMCAERTFCDDCPFGEDYTDRHICKLSPKLYSSMLPCKWDVDDWKEESNATD